MEFTVYLAAKGFVKDLIYELGDAIEVADRLVFAPGPPRSAAWAQNIWLNPQRIPIESISDAAAKLRALQRNWSLFSVRHHRRAKLIEEQLPAVSPKPVRIGTPPPRAPLGSWTLLDKNVIVASPACSSPFPHGEVLFVENKQDPPSRAYLKLWELFTLMEAAPGPGSFCLDLGGSPGGWAWVLASLGCRVLSVDKSPLEPRIEAMPGVEFRQLSAFALDPREVGPVDWLFCDVVCYPDRLWRLVDRWRTFGQVKNFVCTLKFQGATDHDTAAKFATWTGSKLMHLYNNKHELTWVLLNQNPGDGPAITLADGRPQTADAAPAGQEQSAPPAEEPAATQPSGADDVPDAAPAPDTGTAPCTDSAPASETTPAEEPDTAPAPETDTAEESDTAPDTASAPDAAPAEETAPAPAPEMGAAPGTDFDTAEHQAGASDGAAAEASAQGETLQGVPGPVESAPDALAPGRPVPAAVDASAPDPACPSAASEAEEQPGLAPAGAQPALAPPGLGLEPATDRAPQAAAVAEDRPGADQAAASGDARPGADQAAGGSEQTSAAKKRDPEARISEFLNKRT